MANRTVAANRTAAGTRTALTPIAPIQPNTPSGLQLWLKADAGAYTDAGTTLATNGQTVEQWNDQSGNANNASESSGAQRPTYVTNVLNGLPVLRFSSSGSNILQVTNVAGLNRATTAALIVVFIPTTVTLSTIQGIANLTSGGSITNQPYALQLSNGNNPTALTTNSSNAVVSASGGALVSRTPYIMEQILDGTNCNLYINGTLIASTAYNGTIGNSGGIFYVGQQKAGQNRYLNGDVCEVLIYNTNLSTGNRQGVEAYLAQKWGIPTPTNRGGVAAGQRTHV